MMQMISIFDLDKTITRTATFGPFLIHAGRHRIWRFLAFPEVLLTSLAYLVGLIGRARLKEINLGLVLGRLVGHSQLQALSRQFAESTLRQNCLPGALARIESDRAEGRRIVFASASYAFYVVEIANLLRVADVIATKATEVQGKVSPTINGENCYGFAKLHMVEEWMAAQSIPRTGAHIRFYSDHVSDAPCLEWADEAFATNAHSPLRRLAKARGWSIFDWR